jgi:SAM-dependent methyltransferase
MSGPFGERLSLHSLPAEDRTPGWIRFRAQGEGLYPLVRDGDLLFVEPVAAGTNGNGATGRFAAGSLVVVRDPEGTHSAKLVGLRRSPVPAAGGRVLGSVVAAGRRRRRERRWGPTRRLVHLAYLAGWPLGRALIALRKGMTLLDPRAFVGDAAASLRSVRDKFDDGEEVSYCASQAGDGLRAAELRFVERYLASPSSVLDVGCGAGREAFALAALGHDVLGVDAAPGMIAAARRLAADAGGNVRFAVRDATDLGADLGRFDCVLLGDGLYSLIPGRCLRIETLRRAAALLRPGGILVIFPLLGRPTRLSRVAIHGGVHRFAGRWLRRRSGPEPGDVMRRHISPVGDPSRLCFVHLFADSAEVADEIRAAELTGVEDPAGGFWVVGAPGERVLRPAGDKGNVP